MGAIGAMAIKAKPGLVDYIQPDGSVVKIMLHGDEHLNFATDGEGYLLLPGESGEYEYAVKDPGRGIISSGINVGNNPQSVVARLVSLKDLPVDSGVLTRRLVKRSSGVAETGDAKYRYSTSAFPTKGTPHSIVVLVEYQDYKFSMEDPLEYYNDFLNGDNFTRDEATGSCRAFYKENSNGAFVPTFDVFGPVLLKNKRRYYGAGAETHASEMVVEAVEALDDVIDFSQYDHNDDGYVDSIYIVYAHKGEADGGPAESVWPHSWELEEADIFLEADGVKINTYGCSNELKGSVNTVVDGIGTFTHEFGHVLGLPDLYNTNNSRDMSTPGDWSVMDSGSYNNDCRTPANFSAFERYSLGWISPEEIIASGEYSLPNLADSNRAYIMTTEENADEFFIAEYRTLKGWDAYLPASGMLVWHIDFVQSQWDRNSVNNDSRHHYVDLLRADNIADLYTVAFDPFPGVRNVTELGTTTAPSLKSWLNTSLNVTSLYNIREEDGMVKFSARVTEERIPTIIDKVEDQQVSVWTEGNMLYLGLGEADVYDIAGRKAGVVKENAPLQLGKGIYIVKHQKIFIR